MLLKSIIAMTLFHNIHFKYNYCLTLNERAGKILSHVDLPRQTATNNHPLLNSILLKQVLLHQGSLRDRRVATIDPCIQYLEYRTPCGVNCFYYCYYCSLGVLTFKECIHDT